MLRYSSGVLLIMIIGVVSCDKEKDENVFVPTNEWQVVKEGQKLPKGLHVRVNLETGVKEAKLINDKSESEIVQWKHFDVEKQAKIDKIKRKLTQKLGSKSELRSDSEILIEQIRRFKEAKNDDEIVDVLIALEILGHDYDKGVTFIRLNGLPDIIYKNLNSTNSQIKRLTLKLLAGLVQNNDMPKQQALETGAVSLLLRVLNFETNLDIKTSGVNALSALLRSYPKAQLKCIREGGFTVINKIFDQGDLKIQLKLASLIYDILNDYYWSETDQSDDYENVNLPDYLMKENWCANLDNLLIRLIVSDGDDHESIETTLNPLSSLSSKCADQINKTLLVNLERKYQNLATNTTDEDKRKFFTDLQNICVKILHNLNDVINKTDL